MIPIQDRGRGRADTLGRFRFLLCRLQGGFKLAQREIQVPAGRLLRERGSNFILHIVRAGREACVCDLEIKRVDDTVFTVYFNAGFKPASTEYRGRIGGFPVRKRGTEVTNITC